MNGDFKQFCENFNIVDNALDMRQLIRWNGRDVPNKENLAEHTHLVVASMIEILDNIRDDILSDNLEVEKYDLIKAAMYHDSLELLRGDILSLTKDIIDGLRGRIDFEEEKFMEFVGVNLNNFEKTVLKLADLKACYKYLEYSLRFPSNEYSKKVYISCKKKYDDLWFSFCCKYHVDTFVFTETPAEIFSKGYIEDAGVDILLREKVTFLPMSTTSVTLDATYIPNEMEMGFLCARTSAAAKGLSVATCPIDPYFNGKITAIVHNVSNKIIEYDVGEAFCQLVVVPMKCLPVKPRKQGKRGDGKLGSTGGTGC